MFKLKTALSGRFWNSLQRIRFGNPSIRTVNHISRWGLGRMFKNVCLIGERHSDFKSLVWVFGDLRCGFCDLRYGMFFVCSALRNDCASSAERNGSGECYVVRYCFCSFSSNSPSLCRAFCILCSLSSSLFVGICGFNSDRTLSGIVPKSS